MKLKSKLKLLRGKLRVIHNCCPSCNSTIHLGSDYKTSEEIEKIYNCPVCKSYPFGINDTFPPSDKVKKR